MKRITELHIPWSHTGCSLNELWNLPANATFLPDVSLLKENAAEYPSCDDTSIGSVVFVNTTLNTATVAYYNGNRTDSRACFVCDKSNGYELDTTTTERVCQIDGTWSGISTVCGMLWSSSVMYNFNNAVYIIIVNLFSISHVTKYLYVLQTAPQDAPRSVNLM